MLPRVLVYIPREKLTLVARLEPTVILKFTSYDLAVQNVSFKEIGKSY